MVTNRYVRDNVGVVQEVPWKGGRYSAEWIGQRSTTTNVFTSFNPQLQSNLNLNYTQPLVRDFGIDGFRQQIAISRANRDLSDIDLRRTVVSTERNVRNAYWQLVFAQSFLEVQRQSLALAEESLRNNRTRVEVGTMAPIDIVEAENEVARNVEAVIRAEADLERAEDQLRTLVFDPDTPDFWSMRLEPGDSPVLEARGIDVDAAVRNALLNRTDLDTLDKNLEMTDTDIRYFRNQQLPAVDLRVDYQLAGQGGDRLIRTGGFPGMVVGREQRSFGSTLGDIFANEFPNWTVRGHRLLPLRDERGRRRPRALRLERSRTEARRRSLELRVATEVRDAARNVRTNLQRVEATRASRELAERRLEAEQRKFEVGLSTNFLVFQAQRDLATARKHRAAGHPRLHPVAGGLRSRARDSPGRRRPIAGRNRARTRMAPRPPRWSRGTPRQQGARGWPVGCGGGRAAPLGSKVLGAGRSDAAGPPRRPALARPHGLSPGPSLPPADGAGVRRAGTPPATGSGRRVAAGRSRRRPSCRGGTARSRSGRGRRGRAAAASR